MKEATITNDLFPILQDLLSKQKSWWSTIINASLTHVLCRLTSVNSLQRHTVNVTHVKVQLC
uniref:Uncharacterized protein n=1 Tax=Manihot esculenta TaxID=3983 RepID=A0A2C9UR75_MANES